MRGFYLAIEPIAPGLHEGGMLLVAFRDVSKAVHGSPRSGRGPGAPEGPDEEEGNLSRQIYQDLQDTARGTVRLAPAFMGVLSCLATRPASGG